MLFESIEAAGTDDPAAILDAMEDIKFDGVTGSFQYDEYHNAVDVAPMLHYVNGEVAEIYEVEGN